MNVEMNFNRDRTIDIDTKNKIGVVGDRNATILELSYSNGVPEGDKTLIFTNKNGSFRVPVEGDEVKIPKNVTTEVDLGVQLEIDNEEYTWYSEKIKVKLYEGSDASGSNVIDSLVNEKILKVEGCLWVLEKCLKR